jgi:HPt (histidine-containing phosphotransfer) domain-containing protein
MSAQLDAGRIEQLRQAMGSELEEVASRLSHSMSSAIAELEAALRAGELQHARQVAHLVRNDALSVGAGGLLEPLERIESAARDSEPEAARRALDELQRAWPATRAELERLAGRGGAH